jgi:hypothetical protein
MKHCEHIKADGNICQSPKLKNEKFCYFHVAARDRVRRQRLAAERKLPLQVPILEDRNTIQLALGDVVNALLADRIDHRKAALVLYALQTAAANARDLQFESDQNWYDVYRPELDAALPAIEPAAPAPAKKPAAGQVIEKIHASLEKLPPKKSAQPQALIESPRGNPAQMGRYACSRNSVRNIGARR